jgi:hypothetical protein
MSGGRCILALRPTPHQEIQLQNFRSGFSGLLRLNYSTSSTSPAARIVPSRREIALQVGILQLQPQTSSLPHSPSPKTIMYHNLRVLYHQKTPRFWSRTKSLLSSLVISSGQLATSANGGWEQQASLTSISHSPQHYLPSPCYLRSQIKNPMNTSKSKITGQKGIANKSQDSE